MACTLFHAPHSLMIPLESDENEPLCKLHVFQLLYTPFHNVMWQVLHCKGLMIYFLSWKRPLYYGLSRSVRSQQMNVCCWVKSEPMAWVALARDPSGTHQPPHGGLECSARRTFTKPRLHPPDSSEISTVMQGKHRSGQTFSFSACGNPTTHSPFDMERHLSPLTIWSELKYNQRWIFLPGCPKLLMSLAIETYAFQATCHFPTSWNSLAWGSGGSQLQMPSTSVRYKSNALMLIMLPLKCFRYLHSFQVAVFPAVHMQGSWEAHGPWCVVFLEKFRWYTLPALVLQMH